MKKVTYTVSFTHQSRTKTLFAVIMQIQCVLPRSVFYDFFPMLDNLNLLWLFVSEKSRFPEASKHILILFR